MEIDTIDLANIAVMGDDATKKEITVQEFIDNPECINCSSTERNIVTMQRDNIAMLQLVWCADCGALYLAADNSDKVTVNIPAMTLVGKH